MITDVTLFLIRTHILTSCTHPVLIGSMTDFMDPGKQALDSVAISCKYIHNNQPGYGPPEYHRPGNE